LFVEDGEVIFEGAGEGDGLLLRFNDGDDEGIMIDDFANASFVADEIEM
jgi:hypothetical protein